MLRRALPVIGFFVCVVALYEMAYVWTLIKTGWSVLPPIVDYPTDQRLYLVLSALRHSSNLVVNPWYGNPVPVDSVPHLHFPVAFVLFRFVHTLFGSWTAAMLVWTAAWAALSFAASLYCLRSLFPDSKQEPVIFGAMVLLFLNSPLVYAAEIRQLPSLAGFFQLRLPLSRFAFPQVIAPAVLAYWGLQARVLRSGSRIGLAGMAVLQLYICAAFPYFLPLVAVGTGIAILLAKRRGTEIGLSWPGVLAFAAVCGVLDLGYLALAGFATSHGNIAFALQFRRELLLASLKPYVLLLVAASILAMYSRASLPARATVAGLALSNAVFAFSDAFVPATAQMSGHVNYLVTLTTWLPLLVFAWRYLEKVDSRYVHYLFLPAVLLIGGWQGFAQYSSNLGVNRYQATSTAELLRLNLTAKDLVIAPAQFSDDLSCSVPLLSPAKTLFTRDAENILPADWVAGEQNVRQALYLEMLGIDSSRLIAYTHPEAPLTRISSIAQFSELEYTISPLAQDRARAQLNVRERLAPVLLQLETNPNIGLRLLTGFDRVVVIDSSDNPLFSRTALDKWVEVEQTYENNGNHVWICKARVQE